MTPTEPTIELTTHSADETIALGRALASIVHPGDLLALTGELGAGKTQLVRGLAAGLGADERLVASPTFVMVQEYPTDPPLVHVDAYRIQTLSDLESIGWGDEMLSQAVVALEWADRIADELPTDRLDITLAHAGDTERSIVLEPAGTWTQRDDDLYRALQSLAPSPADRAHGRDHEHAGAKTCPVCSRAVEPDQSTYPFCSKRCRMADLGRWFDGNYHLSRPMEDDDE